MKKTIWILAGGAVLLAATWLALQFFPRTNNAIDLSSCTSYFDGCNTCMVQNGQIGGCTRMYCETPAEPKCLESTTGEIVAEPAMPEPARPAPTPLPEQNTTKKLDLSSCTSYFDGCNTCTVKDGQPEACTMMYCETPTEPKCLEHKN